MEKMTKKDMYTALISFAETGVMTVDAADLKAFAQKEFDALVRKDERARVKAAEKRDADELLATVKATLTDEFQTIADITAQIVGDDVTLGKVQSRLTKLVKDGAAVKESIKIEVDGKSVARMGYKIAG